MGKCLWRLNVIAICFAMLDSDEDEIRFSEFYEKYKQLVFVICKDILNDDGLAEDAVIDTFLKFATMFYKVRDINSETTKHYVIIVAKHKAMKCYNKMKNIPQPCEDDEIDAFVDVDFEEKAISRMDCVEIYNEVLRSLPDKYYDVMYMTVVLQLTPKEIAKSLDLELKNVYKRIERAREMIKKKLDKLEKS